MPRPEIHFSRNADADYEFNPQAVEITIFNRRGRVIWRKVRDTQEPIRWAGRDMTGARLEVGSYTCKIRYPQLAQEVYYPFVFLG